MMDLCWMAHESSSVSASFGRSKFPGTTCSLAYEGFPHSVITGDGLLWCTQLRSLRWFPCLFGLENIRRRSSLMLINSWWLELVRRGRRFYQPWHDQSLFVEMEAAVWMCISLYAVDILRQLDFEVCHKVNDMGY